VLDTAGFTTSDVLKVTVYIKSQQNRQLVNPPWLAMFPDEHNRPARHQTVVETLNFDIQIEAFCVKE
jgi:enamine deaminase RidA (YjgF/YER057c/UK114 family)